MQSAGGDKPPIETMNNFHPLMLLVLAFILPVASAQPGGQAANRAAPDFGLIGYASVGFTLTGGAGETSPNYMTSRPRVN